MSPNVRRTILAIEPVFADYTHAVVNAYLLQAIALACESSRIVFAAHPGHHAAVLENAPMLAGRMEFHPIEVVPAGGITFARFQCHLRALTQSLAATDADCLICLGQTPETLFACGWLRIRHQKLPMIAVLHGLLSKVIGWRSRDPRRRWFDPKSAVRVATWSRIRFVVLEDYVKRAAAERGLVPAAQCDVWPHPIADRERVAAPPALSADRPRIGFLGFARPEKGFDDFLSLVNAAEQQGADWCEFWLIGSVPTSTWRNLPARLKIAPDLEDRANYIAAVRSMDYACVFLDNDTYRLTSSGSVIDAIAALRPMIGLETPATRAMFDGRSVGYFCRSQDELQSLIANRDALSDMVRYREFQEGLLALRRGRSPAELSGPVGDTIQAAMSRSAPNVT